MTQAQNQLGVAASASPSPVKMEDFHGLAVRIVNPNTFPTIPLNDVAEGIGADRSGFRKLANRNHELIKDDISKVIISSSQGPMETICVSRDGIIVLLSKVDYLRIKDKDRREKVIEFQKWVKKTLVKEMQIQSKPPVQETVRPVSGAVSEVIGKYMEGARAASREMGVPLDLAMAKALVLAGRDLHMDLTGFARLLPASPTGNDRLAIAPAVNAFAHEGYLSAEEIAMRLGGGLRGKNVNKYLKNHGFIYKNEEKRWCMTDLGAQYGKVFPYAAGSGHVGYYICWRPEVMRASGMLR